jgi:hypothetical protein
LYCILLSLLLYFALQLLIAGTFILIGFFAAQSCLHIDGNRSIAKKGNRPAGAAALRSRAFVLFSFFCCLYEVPFRS